MEGVIYANYTTEKAIDFIELLELECRHIWVWSTQPIYNELVKENWDKHIHIQYSPAVNSIGDCLRDLYTRDSSRDHLIIIGNTNIKMDKLTIHKNLSKKHVGILLIGDGNVSIDIKNNVLNQYEWHVPLQKKGRIMEIAYCTITILTLFQDNFDCDTFHQLLLSLVIGYKFGVMFDKRLSYFDNEIKDKTNEMTFMDEIREIMYNREDNDNVKLELNALRLAYGKTFAELQEALK